MGFTKSRQAFAYGICAKEKLLDWEQLWGDCFQEEICRQSGSCVKIEEDEENFALASKEGRSKGKKSSGGGELSSKAKKKKNDLSEIKCFSCHQFGHYATKCPNRKKRSKKDQVVALQR